MDVPRLELRAARAFREDTVGPALAVQGLDKERNCKENISKVSVLLLLIWSANIIEHLLGLREDAGDAASSKADGNPCPHYVRVLAGAGR